jgi:hypothetical protein
LLQWWKSLINMNRIREWQGDKIQGCWGSLITSTMGNDMLSTDMGFKAVVFRRDKGKLV